jgi:hypothetical protein
VMRDNFARLFEPPLLPNGLPNPRHLSNAAYLALARAAARRGAVRNGLRAGGVAVRFPGVGFAPTRVTVRVRGEAGLRAPGDDPPRPVEVGARATAELAPDVGGLGMPDHAGGGGYDGPLAYRQGKPMRYLFSAGVEPHSRLRLPLRGRPVGEAPESPTRQIAPC